MGMFNFVLDSIKGEIFDFKVTRRVFVASTVELKFFHYHECDDDLNENEFEFRK